MKSSVGFRPSAGLAAVVLLVSSLQAVAAEQTFSNPTKNGLRIDKCVQGAGWGFADPQRCDATRVRLAANEYCRGLSGYINAATYSLEAHWGNHAILTFPKDSPSQKSWSQVTGGDAFKSITCNAQVTPASPATVTYTDPTVNGMSIDWCVQGAGWAFGDKQRCDRKRQRVIATQYCKEFREAPIAVRWTKAVDVGSHAMLSYPKSQPRRRAWSQGAGVDRFRTITCQPEAGAPAAVGTQERAPSSGSPVKSKALKRKPRRK